LIGKSEEKRLLGGRESKNNIKMGREDGVWINLAEVREQWRGLEHSVMNLLVP
jgi:hypothetical protein